MDNKPSSIVFHNDEKICEFLCKICDRCGLESAYCVTDTAVAAIENLRMGTMDDRAIVFIAAHLLSAEIVSAFNSDAIVKVVVVSGLPVEELTIKDFEYEFLELPFDPHELVEKILIMLRRE